MIVGVLVVLVMVIVVVVEVVVVIPATIYAVSQDVVDRQAHLLDSNATALDCWTSLRPVRSLLSLFRSLAKIMAPVKAYPHPLNDQSSPV